MLQTNLEAVPYMIKHKTEINLTNGVASLVIILRIVCTAGLLSICRYIPYSYNFSFNCDNLEIRERILICSVQLKLVI